MPRLVNAVNVLAIRHVKQGTETVGFRIGELFCCDCWIVYHTKASCLYIGIFKKLNLDIFDNLGHREDELVSRHFFSYHTFFGYKPSSLPLITNQLLGFW